MTTDAPLLATEWAGAWTARDAPRIADLADEYADPDAPHTLGGQELQDHVEQTFSRFPDLVVDFAAPLLAEGTVVLGWSARGSHRVSYLGIAPTNRIAEFSGVDVLRVDDDGVRARRHFDRVEVAESLGHRGMFVPDGGDGMRFGYCAQVPPRRVARPGALTLTWVESRDDAEAADADLLSTEVVRSLRTTKGFLGANIFDIGRRKYTLTAFDDPASIRAVHARPHQRSMRRFFQGGLFAGAYTSVWTPVRDSLYLRCPECSTLVEHSGQQQGCECGATPAPDGLF
ncbi:ester cyclase [Isoptericola croceus]|uniref:ester cyclase n=1 Tax=Isoptericola croceus TaxID=3031406 RepID=UPI0023F9D848|nr:ester cyclase [Isoptericola croceus]